MTCKISGQKSSYSIGTQDKPEGKKAMNFIQETGLYRLVFLFAALFILIFSSFSPAIELAGYYENTLLSEYSSRGGEILLDASKLRLDLAAGGGDNELEFTGNVNFVSFHNPVTFDLTSYLPVSIADSLAEREFEVEFVQPQYSIHLDNAFISWNHGGFRVRLGKQQMNWGPAYSYNPTDLFHRKDMFDPAYEKEGVTGLRLDYRWGIGGQGTMIMVPGSSFSSSGYALRFCTHVSSIGYDLALTAHQVTDSMSLVLEDFGSLHQRKRALGIDFSGSLFGLGVWLEGNYNFMATEDDFARVIGGIDYTLISGIYIILEALYNGRAEPETPYPVADWLEYLYFGEPLGRDRLLLGIRKGMTSFLDTGIYLFGSRDGSVVINPRFDANIAQNADISLFGAVSFGEKEGQFPPGNYSITSRLTLYF